MKNVLSLVVLFTVASLRFSYSQSSINIDMGADEAGVQPTLTTADTGDLFVIKLTGAGLPDMFSYQCKLHFDTARFEFVSCAAGLSVEPNILTANGGTIQSICQQQQNPPAADTIEFAATLMGSDESQSVSGTGLLGVVNFRSKLAEGDSAYFLPCLGYTAAFEGELQEIPVYSNGTFYFEKTVSIAPSVIERSAQKPIPAQLRYVNKSGVSWFELTPGLSLRAEDRTVRLRVYDTKGVEVWNRSTTVPVSGMRSVEFCGTGNVSTGLYLCVLETVTRRIAVKFNHISTR